MSKTNDKRDRVVKDAMGFRVELVAYARSLVGEYALAEDVVQQAFLVIFDKYEQFQEGTSILAWCRAIVRIEVFRLKDRQHRERTLASRLLDDAITAAYEEFQTQRRSDEMESWRFALRNCLSRISERARDVMRARFVDGLGYQQIADQLGMTIEAVRKSLYRHKQKIRSCVEANQRQGS
ncbi:MAG: hypothetical protein CMJ76_11000 [Planctomycetaceae bacterium]|nr:hypothetical protein [Planctomycetaceae bacterium]|tara:strand:- start:468 stop:1007 length:540 start_codon:yes stop_codon:yes gene_type:complete